MREAHQVQAEVGRAVQHRVDHRRDRLVSLFHTLAAIQLVVELLGHHDGRQPVRVFLERVEHLLEFGRNRQVARVARVVFVGGCSRCHWGQRSRQGSTGRHQRRARQRGRRRRCGCHVLLVHRQKFGVAILQAREEFLDHREVADHDVLRVVDAGTEHRFLGLIRRRGNCFVQIREKRAPGERVAYGFEERVAHHGQQVLAVHVLRLPGSRDADVFLKHRILEADQSERCPFLLAHHAVEVLLDIRNLEAHGLAEQVGRGFVEERGAERREAKLVEIEAIDGDGLRGQEIGGVLVAVGHQRNFLGGRLFFLVLLVGVVGTRREDGSRVVPGRGSAAAGFGGLLLAAEDGVPAGREQPDRGDRQHGRDQFLLPLGSGLLAFVGARLRGLGVLGRGLILRFLHLEPILALGALDLGADQVHVLDEDLGFATGAWNLERRHGNSRAGRHRTWTNEAMGPSYRGGNHLCKGNSSRNAARTG